MKEANPFKFVQLLAVWDSMMEDLSLGFFGRITNTLHAYVIDWLSVSCFFL
jgi:hypothetical protein